LKCPHCNVYEGKNKASLSAHLRNCKSNSFKKKDENNESDIETHEEVEKIEVEINNTVVNKKTSKTKKSNV
jgi:hypothetical protein